MSKYSHLIPITSAVIFSLNSTALEKQTLEKQLLDFYTKTVVYEKQFPAYCAFLVLFREHSLYLTLLP